MKLWIHRAKLEIQVHQEPCNAVHDNLQLTLSGWLHYVENRKPTASRESMPANEVGQAYLSLPNTRRLKNGNPIARLHNRS